MKKKTDSQRPQNYLEALDLRPTESENLTLTSFRLPVSAANKVEDIADQQGISQAEVYRTIVLSRLENMQENEIFSRRRFK